MKRSSRTVAQRTAARAAGCGIAWVRRMLRDGLLTPDPENPDRVVKDEKFERLVAATRMLAEVSEALEMLRKIRPAIDELQKVKDAQPPKRLRRSTLIPPKLSPEDAHEAHVLASPGVAEGVAQANIIIDSWRAAHR